MIVSGARSLYSIELSEGERRALEGRSPRYTSPYRDVIRAKIMLMAAQGLENKSIASRLDLPCSSTMARADDTGAWSKGNLLRLSTAPLPRGIQRSFKRGVMAAPSHSARSGPPHPADAALLTLSQASGGLDWTSTELSADVRFLRRRSRGAEGTRTTIRVP